MHADVFLGLIYPGKIENQLKEVTELRVEIKDINSTMRLMNTGDDRVAKPSESTIFPGIRSL
jgi:hypothetical protein